MKEEEFRNISEYLWVMDSFDAKDYIPKLKDCKYYIIRYAEVDELDDYIERLTAANISIKGKIFTIDILTQKSYLEHEEIKKLAEIRERLREKGADLEIVESSRAYPLESVIIAREEIDRITNKINTATLSTENNRKLTKLEKFLWAYMYVANRKYHDNPECEASSRDVTSILTEGQDVVCMGYAKLLKEMCYKLGIECYIHYCEIQHEETMEQHANNIVIIDNVPLYADACWDAITEYYSIPTFAYCLLSKEAVSKELAIVSSKYAPFLDAENDLRLAKKYLKEVEEKEEVDTALHYLNSPLMTAYAEVIEPLDSYDNKELLTHFYKELIKKLEPLKKSKMFSIDKFQSALKNVFIASGKFNKEEKAREFVEAIFEDTNEITEGWFFKILQNYSDLKADGVTI